MAEKQFVVFEDGSQKQVVSLVERDNGFWEIKNVVVSVVTGDVQSEDFFTLHKSDLVDVAQWIIQKIK